MKCLVQLYWYGSLLVDTNQCYNYNRRLMSAIRIFKQCFEGKETQFDKLQKCGIQLWQCK